MNNSMQNIVQNVRNPWGVCVKSGDEIRKVLCGMLIICHAKQSGLYFSRKPQKNFNQGR